MKKILLMLVAALLVLSTVAEAHYKGGERHRHKGDKTKIIVVKPRNNAHGGWTAALVTGIVFVVNANWPNS